MASNSPTQSAPTTKTIFNCDLGFIGKAEFKKNENVIKTKIYSIRLNKLIDRTQTSRFKILKKLLKLKRQTDLTHTISALYETSLPELGASSIYNCICSPKAYTIFIIKEDSSLELVSSEEKFNDEESNYSSADNLSNVEDNIQQQELIFEDIFSDDEENDSEEQGESLETKEPDYTIGLKSYLAENRSKSSSNQRAKVIKNLIACATIERVSTFQLPGQDEWVIDLQLMSVREKYRGHSIGKYLINLIQNRNLVGNYDAIVTCSDSEAVKFYEKYAFCVDPILNSKYSHIGDIWTNTTKMCFVPPYCSLLEMSNQKFNQIVEIIDENELSEQKIENVSENLVLNEFYNNTQENDHRSYITELTNMERDFKRWQKLMFSSYQFQSKLFFKLKQEILNLKAKLCAKDSLIDDLKIQNDLLVKNNKLLNMKIKDMVYNDTQGKYLLDKNQDIEKLIEELEKFSN